MEKADTLKIYTLRNFKDIPQLQYLSHEDIEAAEAAGSVFPFKVNSYIADNLIDWQAGSRDPIYRMFFPFKEMLSEKDYVSISELIKNKASKSELDRAVLNIRERLNPDHADQIKSNVPVFNGKRLWGVQHKYKETVLLFPDHGQNCFSWCSFCFRWSQFCNSGQIKFSGSHIDDIVSYIGCHKELTDILITGGDPLTMKSGSLRAYLKALCIPELAHIRNIRIGSRALASNPHLFLSAEGREILQIFTEIMNSGRSVNLVAHFTHPRELEPDAVREAAELIRSYGIPIRCQCALLKSINDNSEILAELWKREAGLGMVPYYLFAERDTGAKHAFELPLIKVWEIFNKAYASVSGLSRSVRGPVMSCAPGKVQILGTYDLENRKAFVLSFLQCRRPELVGRPFLAELNDKAVWWNDLKPLTAFDREFFA